MSSGKQNSSLHHTIDFIDMRAQATAAGLVQLAIELRQAGVIDEAALHRIKDAIAEEIAHSRPRSATKDVYQADIRQRLDRVFAGSEPVGPLPGTTETKPGNDGRSNAE